MWLSSCHFVLSVVAMLFLVGSGVGQGVDNAMDGAASRTRSGWPLVGTWSATSVSMTRENGIRKTLTDSDGPVSLVISDKTCTLLVRTTVLREMTYVADPTQKPCAIDLKWQDDEIVGIYEVGRDRLSISLNDKAKGRPKDFDPQKSDMVFVFRRVHVASLCTIDADGSNVRRILTMPDYTNPGSPEWSPDGGKIAFDAFRSMAGDGIGDTRIFVVNADGTSLANLGFGAMPSWSPDGKQLTCSQYGMEGGPEYGIWVMKADGSGGELIDLSGWGSQWSPKRNEIAYVTQHDDEVRLVVYDLVKRKSRMLPTKNAYSQIYWGHRWSADGKWVCFKGELVEGGCEIAIVSAEEGKREFKVIVPNTAQPEASSANSAVGWSGSGREILVATRTKAVPMMRIYIFDVAGVKPPKLFPGIPEEWECFSPASSFDGKKVVFTAVPPVEPVTLK